MLDGRVEVTAVAKGKQGQRPRAGAEKDLALVMKNAIVLGAGMVGVATAVHLRNRGWSVALVARKEPGRETSYGNTGIIQSEALRPYPMPLGWRELLKIATGRSNDVRCHLASLPDHIGPLLRYWWHSFPTAHAR